MVDDKTERNNLSQEQRDFLGYFYKSFEISQASGSVQGNVLRWLINEGYTKERFFNDEQIKAVLSQTRVPEWHGQGYSNDFVRELNSIGKNVSQKTDVANEVLEEEIIVELVNRDRNFVHRGRYRPSDTIKPIADSHKDPYASLLRKYVIEGESMGKAGLDDLMNKLKERLPQVRAEKMHVDTALTSLELIWEKRHSGEAFWPKGLKK